MFFNRSKFNINSQTNNVIQRRYAHRCENLNTDRQGTCKISDRRNLVFDNCYCECKGALLLINLSCVSGLTLKHSEKSMGVIRSLPR